MPQPIFDFIDDTGASTMTIYRDNLQSLVPPGYLGQTGGEWPWPHIMGYGAVYLADDSIRFYLIVGVYVNMYGTDSNAPPPAPGVPPVRQLMRPVPDLIQCYVHQDLDSVGPYGFRLRTNGPWLRHTLYTATAPNRTHEMIISTSARAAGKHFPAVKASTIRAPNLFVPHYHAVENPYIRNNPAKGPAITKTVGFPLWPHLPAGKKAAGPGGAGA